MLAARKADEEPEARKVEAPEARKAGAHKVAAPAEHRAAGRKAAVLAAHRAAGHRVEVPEAHRAAGHKVAEHKAAGRRVEAPAEHRAAEHKVATERMNADMSAGLFADMALRLKEPNPASLPDRDSLKRALSAAMFCTDADHYYKRAQNGYHGGQVSHPDSEPLRQPLPSDGQKATVV